MIPSELFPELDIFWTNWAPRIVCSSSVVWLVAAMAVAWLRNASAAVRHHVWSLSVVAALLMPCLIAMLPEFQTGWISLQAARPAMEEGRPTPNWVAKAFEDRIIAAVSERDDVGKSVEVAVRDAKLSRGSVSNKSSFKFSPSLLLFLAWALPAAVMLGWTAVSAFAARRIIRRAAPIDDEHRLRLLTPLCAQYGRVAGVALLESATHVSPLCIGWRKPAVLLPRGWRAWPPEQLTAILAHEIAHVLRRDVAWQFLACVARAIYWFHPLAWVAAWRMRADRESACDDWALAAGCPPASYAGALLEVASQLTVARRSAPPAALAMDAGRRFERRISDILSPHRLRGPMSRSTARRLAIGALGAALLAGIISPFRASQAETPDEAAADERAPQRVVIALDRVRCIATNEVNAVAVSSDGKYVAGGGIDKSIKLWSLDSGELLRQFEGSQGAIRAIAFRPRSSLVAAGGDEAVVGLWDASIGGRRRVFRGVRPGLTSLAFSPDGRWLAGCSFMQTGSKSWTGDVLVWDVESGDLLRILETQANGYYRGVAFSPDGALLAAAFDTAGALRAAGVKLWDVKSWSLKATLLRDRGASVSVTFSPDGQYVASGGGYVLVNDGRLATGEAKMWEVDSGKLVETLSRPGEGGYVAVAFSPDGTTLAGQGFGRAVKTRTQSSLISEVTAWNAATHERLWNVRFPFCGDVTPPAFSPDGKKLITCDSEAVRVLDVETGKTLRLLMEVVCTPER